MRGTKQARMSQGSDRTHPTNHPCEHERRPCAVRRPHQSLDAFSALEQLYGSDKPQLDSCNFRPRGTGIACGSRSRMRILKGVVCRALRRARVLQKPRARELSNTQQRTFSAPKWGTLDASYRVQYWITTYHTHARDVLWPRLLLSRGTGRGVRSMPRPRPPRV